MKNPVTLSTFSEKKNLKKHVHTDHLKPQDLEKHEESKPFMCSTCGVNFARKIHLQRHTASVHEGKRPFMCNECGTSFAEKRGLELHISSLHDEKIANISKLIQMKRDVKSARRSAYKGKIFVKPHLEDLEPYREITAPNYLLSFVCLFSRRILGVPYWDFASRLGLAFSNTPYQGKSGITEKYSYPLCQCNLITT